MNTRNENIEKLEKFIAQVKAREALVKLGIKPDSVNINPTHSFNSTNEGLKKEEEKAREELDKIYGKLSESDNCLDVDFLMVFEILIEKLLLENNIPDHIAFMLQEVYSTQVIQTTKNTIDYISHIYSLSDKPVTKEHYMEIMKTIFPNINIDKDKINFINDKK